MRALLAGCALAAIVAVVSGCGGSGKASAAEQLQQRQSDLYQIDQIERKWHDASSHQNIDEMMSIWAPDATFQVGPLTVAGKANIRTFFLTKVQSFNPKNHWVSDTPAYKIKLSVNGDKGRIYFQCHYVDVKTGKIVSTVGADNEIAKINGKWLITHTNAASVTLTQ
jgi:ketosteroid isomerase-like protein